MITLATLGDATAQEVFGQVKNHMLTQGVKSQIGNHCCYRGSDDTKCAAGCLVSDEEYRLGMEGKSWLRLVEQRIVPMAHQNLIQDLQAVHDELPVWTWPMRLKELALKYNLTYEKTIQP